MYDRVLYRNKQEFRIYMSIDSGKKVNEVLSRGIDSFIDPDDSFKEKLQAKIQGEYNKDIIVKFGVDPTRPDIHLGHAVVFRKLRQLQDLGCKIVFLVGDFTALIGDPTGKSKVRPEMEQKEIESNMQTYLDQVDKILRTEKEVFSWIRNSDWFIGVTDIESPENKKVTLTVKDGGEEKKIPIPTNSFVGKALVYNQTRMQSTHLNKNKIHGVTLLTLLSTLKKITYSQLIQRDMFQNRLEDEEDLYMHEMLYPVLQGIDSHILAKVYGSCDLEIGGTDQMFNMMMARDIMKKHEQDPQSVMTAELLVGTDGKEKMSKSLDNYIAITDDPEDMYGKVLSIPDNVISHYFELATYTPVSEVEKIQEELEDGSTNPKDIKMRLAREVVAIYHGQEAAKEAEKSFEKTFSEGGIPDDILKKEVKKGSRLMDVLVDTGLVSSKSQFRRLVDQGAVRNMKTEEKISDHHYALQESAVYKVGKKRFIEISV